jgi:hypothetical protein
MALITRSAKGSRLSITEMDDNLLYLNNGVKLLCKKTVDLNPAFVPLENPIIVISCLDDLLSFEIGETITTDLGGTAIVVSQEVYIPSGGRIIMGCMEGQSYRRLRVSDVSGTITGSVTITGDSSGTVGDIFTYTESVYQGEALDLDSGGGGFIITEMILTNKQCETPYSSGDTRTCSIYTEEVQLGYNICNVSIDNLTAPNMWVGISTMSPPDTSGGLDPGRFGPTTTNTVVGNTVQFSVDIPEGTTSTADLYVYGYIVAGPPTEN